MIGRIQPLRGFLRGTSLLAICCALTVGCQRSTPDSRPQSGQTGEKPRQVVALGRLDPFAGILSISALPGERLTSLQPHVEEGEVITVFPRAPAANQQGDSNSENNPKQNQTLSENTPPSPGAQGAALRVNDPCLLGYLDSHAIRQTQLAALKSKKMLTEQKQQGEIRLADVQLLQAKATYRQTLARQAEIEAQNSRLENLREAAELTQQQYETLLDLSKDDPELVTSHQLALQKNQSQRAMLEYKTANSSLGPTLAAAIAAVRAAKLSVEVAQTNRQQLQEIEQYQLAAINMEIEAARKMVAQSELRLPASTHAGNQEATHYTVLKIFMRPGEFITQLPILQVADLNHMACIAEVYEADAKQVRVGQQALLRSPAFSGNYAPHANSGKGGILGTVRRISKIITSPGLADRNPLAPMDRSVIQVLIEIDPDDIAATKEAGQRVGLQVTVEFQ